MHQTGKANMWNLQNEKWWNMKNVLEKGSQVEYIHFSDEIFSRDKRMKYVPINKEDAILVKCEESRAFLRNMGIEGEILSTPSHSNDSISFVLDDGNCFVGDLEPIDYLDAYEDNVKLKEDWKLVFVFCL